MNKARDLAKNTVIISIGRICTQCMSFFLLPLYTSILKASEYGTVDLLWSYSALFVPLVTLAIEQALFRFLMDVRTDEKSKKLIISTSLIFSAFQITICALILSFVQLFIRNVHMPYFILMIIASVLSATMLQLSRGLGDNIGYTLGSFVSATIQILCNVLFLVLLKQGINGMLLATFAGNMACALFLFLKTRTYKFFSAKSFEKKTLKEMLQYSVHLIPNQISWWIMNASDKTIVAIFLGMTSNGLLAVVHKFPNIYIQFSNILNISWTESAILHINENDAEDYFSIVIDTTFRLFACVNIGIIVCIPFIINFLINARYHDAYHQIPIFMLASLCNVVVSLYGVIYVAHKKTQEIALTAIYASGINVGTHLVLVQFIGLYAASVSSLLGYGIMATYRYFHSRKYLVIKLSNRLLAQIVLMIIVALFTYYSKQMISHIIGFIFVLIMSIVLNANFIKSTFKLLCSELHNKIVRE